LIKDEKTVLIDTVLGAFSRDFIEKIQAIVPPEKIDYIVVNHVEPDHSQALPEIMKLCPKAKIYCTQKCKDGLFRYYYGNWDFQIIKTDDELKLGKRTLKFIEAPMIHWPDSMFTYCPQEGLLLPNDAFGQHYATSQRFDDEVSECELMDEAQKYYGNILWPLGGVILKKIEDIQRSNIPINMIAPSHGIIWRKDPLKIINAYISWAKNTVKPKVVIVYETMWGSTEKMAKKIVEGLLDAGLEIKVFDVAISDRSEIIKEMLEAKGLIFGSSTHDNDMLPGIAGFLEFLKGLKPKNRLAAVFGSYGWAGGAAKEIEGVLKEAGIEKAQESLGLVYAPDPQDLARCFEFGKAFASKIR